MTAGVVLSRRALVGAGLAAAFSCEAARAGTPPRVASLDDAITETLIALGCPPVAAPDTPSWARWVVEPPLPPDVVNLGAEQEVNLEVLAALRPDLILCTPYVDDDLPALRRVAPCHRVEINGPGAFPPLARAAAGTREVARLIGMPDRGKAVVAEAEASFSSAAAHLRGRAAPPLVLVSLLDGRHLSAFGVGSLWHDIVERLGLRDAWTGPTNDWGFGTAGIEALARVPDAALVLVDPVPPDALPTLARSPLWNALPAVRAERVLRLPVVAAFGALPAAMRFARLLADALAEAGLG